MVPTLVMVPTWSIYGPHLIFFVLHLLLMRSQRDPKWSLHSLYGPYEVPTQSWSVWSLPGPYLVPPWSLFGPSLVHTWYLYGPHLAALKNLDQTDRKGGSAHAVMYDRKLFILLDEA